MESDVSVVLESLKLKESSLEKEISELQKKLEGIQKLIAKIANGKLEIKEDDYGRKR